MLLSLFSTDDNTISLNYKYTQLEAYFAITIKW